MRLIAEEAAKRKILPGVGRETIRLLLEHHDLKPWRKKKWCVPQLAEACISAMEDVLSTCKRPHDARNPVVCLDEKPLVPRASVWTRDGRCLF